MNLDILLAEIDSEIALLKQARELLGGEAVSQPTKRRKAKLKKGKHNLTPEGRKRIAEAVNRRWAKQKKITS